MRLVARTLDEEFEFEGYESGTASGQHLQCDPAADVLLLDVMLPGIHGVEGAERVPESDRLGDVTVTFGPVPRRAT